MGVGSSRTSHKDGELVQISEANVLWEIEDGPGDQYRYVLTFSVPAHHLKRSMFRSIRHDTEDGYWSLDDRTEGTPVSTAGRLHFT